MSAYMNIYDYTPDLLGQITKDIGGVERELIVQIIGLFAEAGLPVKVKLLFPQTPNAYFRVLCHIKKSAEAVIINTRNDLGKEGVVDGVHFQLRITNKNTLEHLEVAWQHSLVLLELPLSQAQLAAFDAHMADRQHEYEQFAVYLVWRHFANAPDEQEAAVRAAFAALGCTLLYRMGAALFARDGAFTFAQQTELARQFSAELEYCEENLYAIWDELYTG